MLGRIFDHNMNRYAALCRAAARLLVIVLCCCTLGLLAWGGAWIAPQTAAAQGDSAGTLLQLANNYRASNGLSGWEVNGPLAAAAQGHANWITASGQYGHSGENGSTPQDRARAAGYSGIVYENFVYGTNLDPAGALQWWINSPVHLATLLSQTVHVGIGVVPGERSTLYVLVAGRPQSVRTPGSSSAGAQAAEEEAAAAAEEEDPGAVMVPIVVAGPDANGTVIHIVQQGQTAWAIAARYGVSLDDVLELNGFNLPVVLKPGDPVYISLGPGQSPPPTATPPSLAVVQEGQTIWEIAVAQGLTVDELLELNGLTREDVIKPGDQLWLRPNTAAAPSTGDLGAAAPTAGGVIVMIITPTPRPSATPVLSPTPTSLLHALTASPPGPDAPTPTVTPTPTPVPPTVDLTTSYGPITTAAPIETITPAETLAETPAGTPTGQAVAALPDTLAPATTAPAQTKSDAGSGRDDLLLVGFGALAVVWLSVLGIGLFTWWGRRRG